MSLTRNLTSNLTSDLTSSLIINDVLAPVNTVAPVVSGNLNFGNVLTTTDGTWTGAGTITYTYQWQRNDIDIGGETNNTYTTVAGDITDSIRCVVTATDDVGSASKNSNTVVIIEPIAVNTVAPVVSGTAKNGETLTTTDGTWTSGTTPTFTYQWQNNGVDISGAISQTYLTAYTDIGDDVRCVVTATNTGGSASENSNALSIASQILETNLVFWGIASDQTSILPDASPTSVLTWKSANENGNDFTQISGGNQPSSGVTSQNGLNTLLFDVKYLNIPAALYSLPNGDNTIFIVPKVDNVDSFGRRFIALNNGNNARLGIEYQQSTGTVSFFNTTVLVNKVSTTFTPANLNLITTKREGIVQSISVNSGTFVSNNSAISSADVNTGALGADGDGVGFAFDGEIAEVIIFNVALTAGQISTVQTYLTNKHNII